MARKKKSIKVTLEFTEEQLDEMLSYATFSGEPLTVKDLTVARFNELRDELRSTADNFVFEIVDGSRDACANDWLSDFNNDDWDDEEAA